MLLNDKDIIAHLSTRITPFVTDCPKNMLSYGLSSAGYDIRCKDEFWMFDNRKDKSLIADPKAPNRKQIDRIKDSVLVLEPGGFALTSSVEHFDLPDDIMAVAVGKSTYARCGIIVNVTPLEPGWRGYLTIEISNTATIPAMIYANEGICQLLFFKTRDVCYKPYWAKGGKYQDQPDRPVLGSLDGQNG